RRAGQGRPGQVRGARRRPRHRHRRRGRRHRAGSRRGRGARRHRPQPERRRQALHSDDSRPRADRVARHLRAHHRVRAGLQVRFVVVAALAACASTPTPVPAAAPAPAAEVKPMSQPPALKPHERYTEECRQDLTAARELLARVKAGGPAALDAYNDALIHLMGPQARSELMAEVHPDAQMRAAAEDCTKEAAKVDRDRLLDHDLYQAIAAIKLDGADPDTRRFVERTLRDFRRAGVDKDDATRAKLKDLLDQMVADGSEFDKNIRA